MSQKLSKQTNRIIIIKLQQKLIKFKILKRMISLLKLNIEGYLGIQETKKDQIKLQNNYNPLTGTKNKRFLKNQQIWRENLNFFA